MRYIEKKVINTPDGFNKQKQQHHFPVFERKKKRRGVKISREPLLYIEKY